MENNNRFERNQFTFYKSFYEVFEEVGKVANESTQLKLYKAVIRFGLYGADTDLRDDSKLADSIYKLIRPILASGRKKAETRKNNLLKKQI